MPSPSLSSLIEFHLKALKAADRYSPTTLRATRSWLRNFAEFWGEQSLTELSPERLTDWRRHLTWNPGPHGKPYAENTVNQAVGVVRRFFAWAVANGFLEDDPSAHLVTRRPSPRRRSLTLVQVRRLLDSPDQDSPLGLRDRAVMGLLVETGISRAACSRVDLAHLQLDTGALLTHGRRRQVHTLTDGLLSDMERYLNFSRPLLATDESPALFLDRFGARLSAPSVQQICRRHAQLAGVPLP